MIFKNLLSMIQKRAKRPNSDETWQTYCPLQTFVAQLRDKYSLAWEDANFAFLAPDINTLTYLLTLLSARVLDKLLDRVLK